MGLLDINPIRNWVNGSNIGIGDSMKGIQVEKGFTC